MIETFYRKIRWLYPKTYLKWLEKNLVYAGIEAKTKYFITLSLLYSVSISVLVFPVVMLLGYEFAYLIAAICFIAVFTIFNLSVVLIGDRRGNFAESVLPDALQLMSANIRSGLTPDKALLFAARPEFGILEREIKFAASKAVAGEPLENALSELGDKIKSKIISRTFVLIVEGIKKGGEIASLLEQTADDIRDMKLLKKEVAAQVTMYVIFIFVVIGFASPLLFAFSSHLVETMSSIGSKLDVGSVTSFATMGPLKLGTVKVSSDFLRNYSVMTLTMSAFFGSLILGLLQEGKEKAGVKYIPVILTLDLTIYFVVKMLLASLIGTITPASLV